jgi:hypothetical protein
MVETQREEYTEAALFAAYYYNHTENKRSFYSGPYTFAVLPNNYRNRW